jgi:hypothetical protein
MKKVIAPLVAAFVLGSVTITMAEVTTNTIVPVTGYGFSQCTGEMISSSGEMHLLVTTQETGNGTLTTALLQSMAVGGVGLTTGTTYHFVNISKSVVFMTDDPVPQFTLVFTSRVISDGAAPNGFRQQILHITLNADGNITAEVGKTEYSC